MIVLKPFVFFFKQKTAYEMRISDWSSDVCSSDLHLLAGGVLSFTMEAAEALVADLRRSKGKRSPRTALNLDADDLAALPALISTAWLFDVVPKTMGPAPIPTLHNIDGEEVMFHRVRFPFARGVTQALVGERLDTVPALQRETTHFWNWLGEKPNRSEEHTSELQSQMRITYAVFCLKKKNITKDKKKQTS